MAVFKCKMCGGTLEVQPGESVAVCDSCGTKQTLPNLSDERRANLYDRANYFRRNGEFDKAEGIFESILAEDNKDAEAYWSLVLCKYGINYVTDPRTHKQVPTVNRAQYTPVQTDGNYLSALEHADGYQRDIYEAEAKAIDKIQKGILAISQREDPFDVFICYKETDENDERTQDSVYAQDIYNALTKEGFKVFFSRITLEDKLGSEYEPYIFAALNSAKVMLVVGTSRENLEAVWVKNEWSRYLQLIRKGEEKTLIPVYANMSPYDLPDEFSNLMAQDMSKIGFLQDLVHGVKKLVRKEEKTITNGAYTDGNSASKTAPLLDRAFMALEDGEWDRADDFCEQVLNQDSRNAMAYLGKLMSELHIHVQRDLADCEKPFDDRNNFQKAVRFADPALAKTLKSYVGSINERNERARLSVIYNNAKNAMQAANSEATFKSAATLFATIPGFEDADMLAEKCLERAETCRMEAKEKEDASHLKSEHTALKIKKLLKIAIPAVCACIAIVLLLTKLVIPNSKYNAAVSLMDAGKYSEAIEAFEAIDGYKDSSELAKDAFEQYKAEKLKHPSVGNTIYFGTYEQDSDASNGNEDVEWIVLATENGKALVISKYALDLQPYNTKDMFITWEKCSLRTWLNETFFDRVFSAEEQQMIVSTNVIAEKNPEYDVNPGENTDDKLFLLSLSEAKKYFNSDEERICAPTAYAKAKGDDSSFSEKYKTTEGEASCMWWLRTPGWDQAFTTCVLLSGAVDDNMCAVAYVDDVGVRPAMWINTSGGNDIANTSLDNDIDTSENEYETLTFGSYEQDNNTANGKEPIEWIVLDKKDEKALVISKYALDSQPYNTKDMFITWESCSLRKWLNSTFLNDAFAAEEKAIIQDTKVSADKNPEYDTDPGNATTDKMFLLSINEVNQYFDSNEARKCASTEYAVANGAYVSDSGNCWWWLRSPGIAQSAAADVRRDGSVQLRTGVNSDTGSVRPAMWINMES